jgi:hypothetical protein
MAWNKLCKLSFLRNNKIAFLDGQLHEDILWTYRTMLYIQSIAIVHKVLYFYRIRANSIVTNTTKAEAKVNSYYETLQVMQQQPHPCVSAYYKPLLFYWQEFIKTASSAHVRFKDYYFKLRETCSYNPIELYKQGKMTLKEVKHRLHFALPPTFGYWYVCLREFKNNMSGK